MSTSSHRRGDTPTAVGFSPGAAPFVPNAGSASGTAPGQFKVTAAPFVPGTSTPQSTSSTSTKLTTGTGQLTSHAQPFVPGRSNGTPSSGQQAVSSSTTGSNSLLSHLKGPGVSVGSPHRGRGGGAALAGLASPSAGAAAAGGQVTPVSSATNTSSSVFSPNSHHHASSPLGTGRGVGRGGRGEHAGGRGRGGRGTAAFLSASDPYGLGSGSSPAGSSALHGQRGLGDVGHHSLGLGGGVSGPGGAGASLTPLVPRLPGYRPMHHMRQHTVPGRAPMSRQAMDEGLRQQLAAASYAVQAQWTPPGGREGGSGLHLPDRIHTYHSLYPLDTLPATASATSGSTTASESFSHALRVRSLVLKGVSAADGAAYALRRVDGKQVMPSADVLASACQAADTWAPLASHPHLVALRSAFVSSELDGVSALFLVYDYHPGCVTLATAHLTASMGSSGMVPVSPPPEHVLWMYLVQLTSLLRCVHAAGLALHPSCLHTTKVLLTPSGKLRVTSCGLVGAITGEGTGLEREELAAAHRMDLTALGQLMLTLACAGLVPPCHAGSIEVLSSSSGGNRYSPELRHLIAALLTAAEGGPLTSIRQLASYPAMVERTLQQLDAVGATQDLLMNELAKECENGRLFRLLVKLGFVVERPEGDVDGSWAETGDRYLLKLFRDFVFHQRIPEGSPGAGGPLLDWGYVLEALNKVDAGVPERILLLARDEAAMLVASYADIKRCVEHSYADLQARARPGHAPTSS